MKIILDFDGLASNATAAMRRVTALFQRANLPVLDVASDGKTRRVASISYREVTLSFADSQKLALRVKSTGDVYQLLLNGKVTPIKEQDDPAKAVAELVAMLDKSRARFQKRLAAMAMKPPEGAKTAAPKLRDTLNTQIAEVREQIVAAKETLAELQAA